MNSIPTFIRIQPQYKSKMSLNTLTDTQSTGNLTIQLIKDTPDGVVRYFDFDNEELNEKSNLDVHVKMHFPDQSLRPHNMFINLSEIRRFLDKESIHQENIDDLSYERFECFLCMGGAESSLFCHDKTRPIHFHKTCYYELVDCVEQLIKENPIAIQSEEKLEHI